MASSASFPAWETCSPAFCPSSFPSPHGFAAFLTSPSCAGVNLGIGVLVGSIPLLGDAFDIGWKANRRNYLLLQRHLGEPRKHTWKDWAFLAVIACAMALIFAIPVLLVVGLFTWLIRH